MLQILSFREGYDKDRPRQHGDIHTYIYVALKSGNTVVVVFKRVKNVWRKKPWENVHSILVSKLYPDFEFIP